MGKGQKPRLILSHEKNPADKSTKGIVPSTQGCNAPTGCILKEDVPAERNAEDFVKVICSTERCTRSQYLHRQCYDEWEAMIVKGVQKSQQRTRDWTDDQVRRQLWSRVWDIAARHCKCVCGGFLKKADTIELPAAAVAGNVREEPKKKTKTKSAALPALAQTAKHTYTKNVGSSYTAAGTGGGAAAVRSLAASMSMAGSMESLQTSEGTAASEKPYIPGLHVTKTTNSKVKQKQTEKKTCNEGNERPTSGLREGSIASSEDNYYDSYERNFNESPVPSMAGGYVAPRRGTFSKTYFEPFGDKSSPTNQREAISVDEYMKMLEVHVVLPNPTSGFGYRTAQHEMKVLVEEMNAVINKAKRDAEKKESIKQECKTPGPQENVQLACAPSSVAAMAPPAVPQVLPVSMAPPRVVNIGGFTLPIV